MRPSLIALALTIVAVPVGRPEVTQNPPVTEFVGTTPCGDATRAFLGGLPSDARCHAITWKLDVGVTGRDGAAWTLAATYHLPAPSNPNAMVDGPRVAAKGKLERTGTTYRLMAYTGQSISFRQVSDTLMHVLTNDNKLMVGTAGWSYTLNRVDVTDKPGSVSQAPDGSYTISPRATGSSVFGLFEGRTPCMGIARELRITSTPDCLKVKWRVTLMQKAGTAEPTTYKIEGTLHRQQAREGSWRILRGAPGNSNVVVYQLDGTSTEGPLLLWQADNDVLFFLNQNKQPLVGTIDFSYTLNRVTG